MGPDFQSESWEQDGPSYVQSYVVSAFILLGILGIASNQVPASPLAIIMCAVWLGTFLYWFVQNRHAERTFCSDRITVINGRVIHSLRYAIPEAIVSEIEVSDIKEMKVYPGPPFIVELIGSKDAELFSLPNEVRVDQLRLTLEKLNPGIRMTSG